MIRRFLCAILALTTLSSPAIATGEEPLTPAAAELVRLHVVAGDDTDAAQSLKLKVRDAVLLTAQELLAGCSDADSAYQILTDRLSDIEDAACACAEANGFTGSVVAETGVYDFPDRDYDGISVPAGRYRAVRVTLGAGQGRNWWCVLYPTLCLPSEDGYSSVLAEWFERWFGGGEA